MTTLAFVGAGRVAQVLARAWVAHGEHVVAVASRTRASAASLAAQLPGCVALGAAEAIAEAELVFLTVPDDAIRTVVQSLPWRPGQWVVHCSGATELSALEAAAQAGAVVAGFHPLQIFSDVKGAAATLPGSSVAIEVHGEPDAELSLALHRLARVLGLRPFSLPPGARAAYHGSASFAASFMLSLLDEAASVWEQIGIDREAALDALLPLAFGTLQAAKQRGLAGALSGPISRGDGGVVASHIKTFEALGGEHAAFYKQLALRQLPLARMRQSADDASLDVIEALLRHPSPGL
jgi:predicted short-subunit dehydrogenase-like oxidoreductase (DUF2520 family)